MSDITNTCETCVHSEVCKHVGDEKILQNNIGKFIKEEMPDSPFSVAVSCNLWLPAVEKPKVNIRDGFTKKETQQTQKMMFATRIMEPPTQSSVMEKIINKDNELEEEEESVPENVPEPTTEVDFSKIQTKSFIRKHKEG